MSQLSYTYTFRQDDKPEVRYEVKIDAQSLECVNDNETQNLPSWTELDHKKCAHCPLNSQEQPHCPVAQNIYELLEMFKKMPSTEVFDVEVQTPERSYQAKTDLQQSLGSLFGLIMATSKCPTMKFLRPMGRFHLPFASLEETIIRSLGNFLIHCYFDDKLQLEHINETMLKNYTDLNTVNQCMIDRIDDLIRNKNLGDADQNAIIVLDSFATLLSMELTSDFELLKVIYDCAK